MWTVSKGRSGYWPHHRQAHGLPLQRHPGCGIRMEERQVTEPGHTTWRCYNSNLLFNNLLWLHWRSTWETLRGAANQTSCETSSKSVSAFLKIVNQIYRNPHRQAVLSYICFIPTEKVQEVKKNFLQESGMQFSELEEKVLQFHLSNLEFACGSTLDKVWETISFIFLKFCLSQLKPKIWSCATSKPHRC